MGEEAMELHGRKRLLLRSVLAEQDPLFAGKSHQQVFLQCVPCVLCRLVCFVLLEEIVFGIIDVVEKIVEDFHFIPLHYESIWVFDNLSITYPFGYAKELL